MAFRKITEGDMLGKGNVGRPDTPGVSTAEMQRILDELPREVLAPAFNELAGQLEAETAAADIGAAAPEGVTAAPAGKLQAVLNGLRDLVKAHTDRADNPHGVTAAQAGAYSKAETDAAISAKVVELGAGDMAKSIYDPGNEQQPLLPRNGDGSNVTASFTEAEQDADIQTGEELTVLFGKIKKRFSTYDADGDGVVDEAEKVSNALTLKNAAGEVVATFDGSEAAILQLTAALVGALGKTEKAADSSKLAGLAPVVDNPGPNNRNTWYFPFTGTNNRDGTRKYYAALYADNATTAGRASNLSMGLNGTDLWVYYS